MQVSTAPEASIPKGNEPAEQLEPLTKRAEAVPTLIEEVAMPNHPNPSLYSNIFPPKPEKIEFVVVETVSMEFEPPTLTTGCESESGEVAVKVVVATESTFPDVPANKSPCPRDDKNKLLEKVVEALENNPPKNPMTDVVELPQD